MVQTYCISSYVSADVCNQRPESTVMCVKVVQCERVARRELEHRVVGAVERTVGRRARGGAARVRRAGGRGAARGCDARAPRAVRRRAGRLRRPHQTRHAHARHRARLSR